jgi:hypothetical protein
MHRQRMEFFGYSSRKFRYLKFVVSALQRGYSNDFFIALLLRWDFNQELGFC